MAQDAPDIALAALPEDRRREAMARLAVLRPALEEDVPLARAAAAADVPLRTAQRWLARYQRDGLAGLARPTRSDAGQRRLPPELVGLMEGLGLRRPRPSAAAIHRKVAPVARARGWPMPSTRTVRAIVARLDPAMATLAHEGPAAFRDRFELLHRHRAEAPNALWQADHTLLDVLILDEAGRPARPWLTTVIDDHSRVVAGYTVLLGAPSTLNTSLALRQAIWRKADPAWAVCGVPDILYVDHGADFTSGHLEQVAADLRIRLVHSAVARPQGRGKVERLFGTITRELLPELPRHLVEGKPVSAPRLSLAELDRAIGSFVVNTYNARTHSETGTAPLEAWAVGGFLPRLPESLEELDLLLVMHAKPRIVQRDGIRFEGLRYVSPTLAAFVREPVTVRFDPRDLSEIRVFHRDRFLCRAISEEHAGSTVTLKDIEAARRAHRRALRTGINERVARVAELLAGPADAVLEIKPAGHPAKPTWTRLRLYEEDG
jgi:putative transposase